MLKTIVILAAGLLATQVNAEDVSLKTQMEKVSYAIGVDIAKNFKQQGIEINVDSLTKGMRDGLAGGKLLMTDEELVATLTSYQAELNKKRAEAMKAAAEENQKAGQAFLEENKKKEGVVTLPSGLQYKILQAGNGPKPKPGDTVECNYRGTLINGKEFDSSYKRGQPASFPVTGVIRGWTEALQLMPVGSKWQLFIPAQLAYGMRGAGPDIGPNSTLIFEIELLSIK